VGGYTPVVGAVLPFESLASAHALAESFHKPGNIVVRMGEHT
jgi:NADPH:quinone reductase-like Zn-dependent oxidoreductase